MNDSDFLDPNRSNWVTLLTGRRFDLSVLDGSESSNGRFSERSRPVSPSH